MASFDAEHLIGQLLLSGLGGGGRRKRKKRLSRSLRRAALSPQGLTLLGGIAFAAIEHLRGKSASLSGHRPPTSPPVGARSSQASDRGPTLPPVPGSGHSAAPPPLGAKAGTDEPSARPIVLPPVPGSRPAVEGETDGSAADPDIRSRGQVLVQAMVEAAKADGRVEPEERARILEQLQAVGADAAAREFVRSQLDRPLDLEGLLTGVGSGDGALAAEVYVASRVVIADETPAESAYLALLAARLGLSDELVRELRSQVDQALESTEEESSR